MHFPEPRPGILKKAFSIKTLHASCSISLTQLYGMPSAFPAAGTICPNGRKGKPFANPQYKSILKKPVRSFSSMNAVHPESNRQPAL